jgi:hypothetical protein
VQHAVNSIESRLGLLESSAVDEILDGGGDQDYEAELLRLDADLSELRTFVPSPLSARLKLLQNRLTSVIAAVDQEIARRNEAYARLLYAVAQASSGPALTALKMAITQQLPPTMRERRELQAAIRQADDRLFMAELEGFEVQDRAALRAKLDSVRGVDLANLLFREYGIDLPTARKLVIDRNNGNIDLEHLVDRVLEIHRRQHGR